MSWIGIAAHWPLEWADPDWALSKDTLVVSEETLYVLSYRGQPVAHWIYDESAHDWWERGDVVMYEIRSFVRGTVDARTRERHRLALAEGALQDWEADQYGIRE